MIKPIKHIWFDMEGTLTVHTPEWEAAHDQLLLETYAEVEGQQPSGALWQEYSAIYREHGTHSAAFRSLCLPSDFWQEHFAKLDEEKYYKPDERVYGTLAKLKDLVPISVFTNAKPERLANTLRVINIDPAWFTFTLTGDEVPERKPALHGFERLLELSQLPAADVLYVGDRVQADILPAKSLAMQTALIWSEDAAADYSFKDFTGLLELFK
jgi:HAD superfamily hydrolase (TIGR01549 family)